VLRPPATFQAILAHKAFAGKHPLLPKMNALMAILLASLIMLAASDSTPIRITNQYDDDLWRFSFGDPGHCVGEKPLCGDVGAVKRGATQTFYLAPGANYLSIGGGIKTTHDGSVCHTWLSDDTFCASRWDSKTSWFVPSS